MTSSTSVNRVMGYLLAKQADRIPSRGHNTVTLENPPSSWTTVPTLKTFGDEESYHCSTAVSYRNPVSKVVAGLA
jgi:hypothetical protein